MPLPVKFNLEIELALKYNKCLMASPRAIYYVCESANKAQKYVQKAVGRYLMVFVDFPDQTKLFLYSIDFYNYLFNVILSDLLKNSLFENICTNNLKIHTARKNKIESIIDVLLKECIVDNVERENNILWNITILNKIEDSFDRNTLFRILLTHCQDINDFYASLPFAPRPGYALNDEERLIVLRDPSKRQRLITYDKIMLKLSDEIGNINCQYFVKTDKGNENYYQNLCLQTFLPKDPTYIALLSSTEFLDAYTNIIISQFVRLKNFLDQRFAENERNRQIQKDRIRACLMAGTVPPDQMKSIQSQIAKLGNIGECKAIEVAPSDHAAILQRVLAEAKAREAAATDPNSKRSKPT